METAVSVDEETKDRLEELQAESRLRTGTAVTQKELLEQFIDDAYDSRELSFTDATTVALGERHDIDCVLRFDDDFDGVVNRVDPTAIGTSDGL